ncbi:MAG: hypothetical protein GY705_05725 [Bacteroidetes bacterium]|nr:hypothetical protein [Bacteroidota bacterium]
MPNNPFKGLNKKVNQGTFTDELNLKVTLPAENSDSSLRTTKASGSGQSLPGDNSTPKRGRDYSLDDPNPEKKLDDRETPTKSSAESDDSECESIQTNLTEKELIEHVNQVSLHDDNADSYAAAAKKPKLDLPDLVYIQKGSERREPILKAHYDAFMENLLENIMKIPTDQAANIQIDWHGWGLGRGVIACLNPQSANFVKKIASEFTIRDLKFRAWSKHEWGKREIFSGRLPGVTWKSRKPVETLRWIMNLNGLKNADFHLLSYIKTPQGVLIRFESSRDLTVALRRRKFVLNAGIAKLRLECKNAESGPINLLSEAINPDTGDGNILPNESAKKHT